MLNEAMKRILMKRLYVSVIVSIVLPAVSFAHAGAQTVKQPLPIAIIQEPVVEATGDTWAVVAWTTHTGGSSIIHAGIHKNSLRRLAQTPQVLHLSEMPSYQEQEYTHRVSLNNLKPGTTYYFRADSGLGSDSGTASRSRISQFTTTGQAAFKNQIRTIGMPLAYRPVRISPGSPVAR
jgi:phosphodiesterase/alkaline phosphatase D-like protein